jgi:hypothetical protein
MGWFGIYHYVRHTLLMYGCDFQGEDPITAVQDEHGTHEPGPAFGMSFFMGIKDDDSDVAIADNVVAFIKGKPAGTVASYLNSTSYGVRNIPVI